MVKMHCTSSVIKAGRTGLSSLLTSREEGGAAHLCKGDAEYQAGEYSEHSDPEHSQVVFLFGEDSLNIIVFQIVTLGSWGRLEN